MQTCNHCAIHVPDTVVARHVARTEFLGGNVFSLGAIPPKKGLHGMKSTFCPEITVKTKGGKS